MHSDVHSAQTLSLSTVLKYIYNAQIVHVKDLTGCINQVHIYFVLHILNTFNNKTYLQQETTNSGNTQFLHTHMDHMNKSENEWVFWFYLWEGFTFESNLTPAYIWKLPGFYLLTLNLLCELAGQPADADLAAVAL